MKDGANIKCMSIGGAVAIVITMLLTDGVTAQVAAASLLAALTGAGGYVIAKRAA